MIGKYKNIGRVICITIIRAGFHDREIVAAVQLQWSLSAVKTIREELETCEW